MPQVQMFWREKIAEYIGDHPEVEDQIETCIRTQMEKLVGITNPHDLAFDSFIPDGASASADGAIYISYSVREGGLVPVSAGDPEFTRRAAGEVLAALKNILPKWTLGVWFIPYHNAGYTEG